mmetsp:Transcript_5844/g.8971  ORF Transcript_5844/g.8971 Transcript_5844/m.8971 type:complete len:95 (+) Transcript_5844:190-474(+)
MNAPINRYPYTVSLQDQGGHYCDGSVIAPDLVISPAHCPSYLYSDVVGNPHNVDDPPEGTETFGIVTYAIHPSTGRIVIITPRIMISESSSLMD